MSEPSTTVSVNWHWAITYERPLRLRVVHCPDCGHLRYWLSGGPHSPYLHNGKRIDCLGREVQP